jgi:hypothetical protein
MAVGCAARLPFFSRSLTSASREGLAVESARFAGDVMLRLHRRVRRPAPGILSWSRGPARETDTLDADRLE